LVAQEFDTGALRLTGEVHILAERVDMGGGLINLAVSGKLLLYSDAGTASQFTWFDRGASGGAR
jgi:hypothetical protein